MTLDICSDKTGTFTQWKMVVNRVQIPSQRTYSVALTDNQFDPTVGDLLHESFSLKDSQNTAQQEPKAGSPEELLQQNQKLEDYLNVGSLANLAHVHKTEEEWKARGDPTEIEYSYSFQDSTGIGHA